jgi:hypothetical protein
MKDIDRAVVPATDEYTVHTLDPDSPVPTEGLAFMPDGVYYNGVMFPGLLGTTATVVIPHPVDNELAYVEVTLRVMSIKPTYVHPMHEIEQWPVAEDGSTRLEIHYR